MITTELKVYLCNWRNTDEAFHVLRTSTNEPLPVAAHLEMCGYSFRVEQDKAELKMLTSGWVSTIHAYRVCDEAEADDIRDCLLKEGFAEEKIDD